MPFPPGLDPSYPALRRGVPAHAFEPARVSPRPGGVRLVLRGGCHSQIAGAVVEGIPVDVIHVLVRLKRAAQFTFQHDPVHEHGTPPVILATSPLGIRVSAPSVTPGTPGIGGQVEHDFIGEALACHANANVVTLGDLNDFEFSAPVQTLAGTILDNLVELLPAD